jgi:ribonuclease BN (tRNA processing enzyme)
MILRLRGVISVRDRGAVPAMAIAILLLALCLLSPLQAQTNDSGMPNRTEILFLGTAGGPPLRLDRSEPSTLLIVDGRPYLIDCGIGTMRRMLRAHIASESIHTIFFTHLHADHDLGLADVMANDFLRLNATGSTEKIQVYGPPQTKGLVDAAFQYITVGFTPFAAEPGAIRAGLVNGEIKSPFVAHEIQGDGVIYQDDKIRVTAAENTHYALMPPQSRQQMKSYSYRIETPHGVIVFTGDTGPSDAVARLAQGADVLVSEVEDLQEAINFVHATAEQNHWPPQRAAAMIAHFRQAHLDVKEVGALATKAHAKSVVLYHYDPSDPAAEVAKVKEYFSGPVFASADLDRYCLETGKDPKIGGILHKCGVGLPESPNLSPHHHR